VRISDLIWDDWNEEHVARHGVEPWEVEEIVARGDYHLTRVRRDRYAVIGQTDAGRYLTVFADRLGQGMFFVVTARDADADERRLYRRHRGGR
jgi:uncharacterized DUF497 family protein